jgi:hypothetical protein
VGLIHIILVEVGLGDIHAPPVRDAEPLFLRIMHVVEVRDPLFQADVLLLRFVVD